MLGWSVSRVVYHEGGLLADWPLVMVVCKQSGLSQGVPQTALSWRFQGDVLIRVLQLIKILGNIQEKNRERPLCFPYSIKTRVLLHAHFQRLKLSKDALEAGWRCLFCPDCH